MRLLTCLILAVLAFEEVKACALFCYYVPSGRTRREAQLTPDKLPSPFPCSHLVYGFASIDSQHEIVPANTNDLPTLTTTGTYQKLNNLKVQNPQLRTMLAVRKQGRVAAVANKFTRTALAQSVVNHLRSNNLDGIVLHTDAHEMNSNQFIHTLNVMKIEFDREAEKSQKRRLQLVVAVPAKDIQILSNKLTRIVEQVDFIYLLSHITAVSADKNRASYVDPLYPTADVQPEDTMNYNVKQLESTGVPKEKMIVGLTFWGHSYILANKAVNTHGAPTTDFGFPGKYTDTRGRLAYFEICEEKQTDFGDFQVHEDQQAIATSFTGRLDQWFSFNQPGDIYRKKIEWITSQPVGGVGVYSLDADDFFGTCQQGEFPLLKATVSNLKCNLDSEPQMMIGDDMPIIPARIDHSDVAASFDSEAVSSDGNGVQGLNAATSCIRNCYYRPQVDSAFDFTSLDGSWCTHLTISSVRFQPDGTIQISPSVALALENFQAWHPMNPKPQLILSVGGEQSAGQWRSVLQNDDRRETLVREIERILNSNGASGVDLSWVVDSLESISDRNIHAQLVKDVRDRLRPTLTVIVSVTPDSSFTDRYNYSSIIKNADFINLISYRFYSAQRPTTGHQAPLFADSSLQDPKMSVEGFASFWVFKGANKAKLIIGVTAEAQTEQLTEKISDDKPRLGMPSVGPGDPRSRTESPGTASYDEVCELLAEPGAQFVFLKAIGVPIAALGNQFISYDDPKSVTLKTTYASLGGYAGVALFALEYDNSRGICPERKPFPLLLSIVRAQICPICSTVVQGSSSNCDASFKVVCFYRLPNATSPNNPLLPSAIPFDRCTDIVATDALLSSEGKVKLADSTAENNFNDLRNLKSQFGSTKLSLAVRCNMTSDEFKELLDDNNQLIDSLIMAVHGNDLDGIVLECDHILTPTLRVKFSNFLIDLRKALRELVTASSTTTCPKSLALSIPGWRLNLSPLYETAVLNQAVNGVLLESYETAVAESSTAKPLSPLYNSTSTDHSISNTLNSWTKQKLHSQKIILVLPAFAIAHHLSNTDFNQIGAPVDSAGFGDDKRFIRTQKELCQIMAADAFMREISFQQVAAFACAKSGAWLSYETRQTAKYKSNYARKQNLGGVGLLAINDDDYSNFCRLGAFPLLSVIANAAQCN